jgi:RimJ/RimL family protein N-acetyltransferase
MAPAMPLSPITLSGRHIRLEPLSLAHVPALTRAGLFAELWRLQPAPVSTQANMLAYVMQALDEQQRGLSLPFVMVRQGDGEVIGSTRYMDIALPHRRLEIGATWLTPACQRSGANTEAKLLLLTHAFESLAMIRVVFKTEVLNEQSRQALARIGAVQEGIFRQHLVAASGRRRDMVYFSILEAEWRAARAGLLARLR